MEQIRFLVIVILIGCTNNTNIIPSDLKNTPTLILGKWEYMYSLYNNSSYDLLKEKYPPYSLINFKSCNDAIELKVFSDKILKLRSGNLFECIKSQCYSNDKIYDSFYPVGRFINDSSLIAVSNYGLKTKDEYFIKKINSDTLIIITNRLYDLEGEKLSSLQHAYLKIE